MKEYICAETQVKNYAGAITGTTLWKGKELVRCKDCRRYPECCRPPRNDPDWYCADGERKDE